MNFPPVFQPRDEILAVEGRGRVEAVDEAVEGEGLDGYRSMVFWCRMWWVVIMRLVERREDVEEVEGEAMSMARLMVYWFRRWWVGGAMMINLNRAGLVGYLIMRSKWAWIAYTIEVSKRLRGRGQMVWDVAVVMRMRMTEEDRLNSVRK